MATPFSHTLPIAPPRRRQREQGHASRDALSLLAQGRGFSRKTDEEIPPRAIRRSLPATHRLHFLFAPAAGSASAWPIPLNSAKPTVSLKVDTDYQFNGTPSQRGFNLPRLERLLIKEYQSSQAFEQVALGLNTADVYAKVKVSNHETGSMLLAILSGATLLVIPGTFDNEWIMETRFFDANGKEQGRVVKREITTTWTQLLLVFALPFNESTDEILAKLARSTLEEASQRKLL